MNRERGEAAPDWGSDVAGTPHRLPLPSALPAVGVDPVLAGLVKGDGTLAREAYRRFERLTLQPLARIAEAELAVKLDAPDLALSFDSLRASDFAGVARS